MQTYTTYLLLINFKEGDEDQLILYCRQKIINYNRKNFFTISCI